MNWTHTISLQQNFDIQSTFHGSTKICHQKIAFINLMRQNSYVRDSHIFFKMLLQPEAMYLYNSGSMITIERGTPSWKCEFFLQNAPSRRHICSNVGNVLGNLCKPISIIHLSVISNLASTSCQETSNFRSWNYWATWPSIKESDIWTW